MSEQGNFRVRMSYVKINRLAMLSHLEVARALERAVRRAGLPFVISQGFSPHMKISFGAALPVGVGGSDEIFDLNLKRSVTCETLLQSLQASCVEDLMVKDCAYLADGAQAASLAFPFSTYRTLLSFAPEELSLPEEVVVVRKKKEKHLKVSDFLVQKPQLRASAFTFCLEAKPTGSLRPDALMHACLQTYNKGHGGCSTERSWLKGKDDLPLYALSLTRIAQSTYPS